MASMSEILHHKYTKDLFHKLEHSERAKLIAMYSTMQYQAAFRLNEPGQGKILFQILYTAKNSDEIRQKVEHLIAAREEGKT